MRVARLRPLEGEPIDRGLVEGSREELGAENLVMSRLVTARTERGVSLPRSPARFQRAGVRGGVC